MTSSEINYIFNKADVFFRTIIESISQFIYEVPSILKVLLGVILMVAGCGIVLSYSKAIIHNCKSWKPIENSGLTYGYFLGTGQWQHKLIYKEAHTLLRDRKWSWISFAGIGYRLGNYTHNSKTIAFLLSIPYIVLFVLGLAEMMVRITVGTILFFFLSLVHRILLFILKVLSMLMIPVWRAQDKFSRVEQHCPHCYATFNMPQIRCAKCGHIHNDLSPGRSGVLVARCQCGKLLPAITILGRSRLESVCPKCNEELAATNAKQFSIQLIGGNTSGKTAYLAAFQHIYLNCYDGDSGLKIVGKPTNIFGDLEKSYVSGMTEASSASMAVPYNFVHIKDGLDQNNLVIYDIPDEVILSGEYEKNPLNFGYSDGIIILIDPLSISSVRHKVNNDVGADALVGYSQDDPDNLIVQFIHHFSQIVGRSAKRMNNVPVAVVIGKADVKSVKHQIGFPKINSSYNLNPSLYGNDIQNARNTICRNYLLDLGLANALNNLESVFTNVNYFPASPIGHVAHSGESFVPFGVLEPVLWLTKIKRANIADVLNKTLQFVSTDDFQDEATARILKTKYEQAETLYADGQYEAATKAFSTLGRYRDSQKRADEIKEIRYKNAISLLSKKQFDCAIKEFRLLITYKDSQVYTNKSLYQKAQYLLNNNQFDAAQEIFEKLGNFNDSKDQIKNVHYKHAEYCIACQDFIEAYELFLGLSNYRDSSKRAESLVVQTIKQGKSHDIQFGRYKWRALKIVEDKALLVTERIIEKRAFNMSAGTVHWDASTIRSYLNGDFYGGFSTKEKEHIIKSLNANNPNIEYGTSSGEQTNDFVFILSDDEAKHLFSCDEERIAYYDDSADSWLLRSNGGDENYVAIIDAKGKINYGGNRVESLGGIRPAIWIRLQGDAR